MRYPDLPPQKRLLAASTAGWTGRLAIGDLAVLPFEQRVATLIELCDDPQILGHTMGPYLAQEPQTQGAVAAIALLRAAGADEDQAQRNAAWQRWRVEHRMIGRYELG